MSDAAPQVEDTPVVEPEGEIDSSPAPADNEFLELLEEDFSSPEESATPEEPADKVEPEGTPTTEEEAASPEVIPEATVEPEVTSPPADSPSELAPIDMAAVQEQFAQQFAMSEDDIAAFEANPGTALPQMMAKVQIRAMQQTMAAFQQMLPGLLQQQKTQSDAATEVGAEVKKSYAGLSDLNEIEKGQMVAIAKNTKAMFPTLSATELLHKSVKAFSAVTGKVLGTPEVETPAPTITPHQPAMGSSMALPSDTPISEWEELIDD